MTNRIYSQNSYIYNHSSSIGTVIVITDISSWDISFMDAQVLLAGMTLLKCCWITGSINRLGLSTRAELSSSLNTKTIICTGILDTPNVPDPRSLSFSFFPLPDKLLFLFQRQLVGWEYWRYQRYLLQHQAFLCHKSHTSKTTQVEQSHRSHLNIIGII